jgi:hypothetical protein
MEISQNPEAALLFRPGFELDVFIYRYIFDGVLEAVDTPAGKALERPIPSFSRRADAAKALLIKMIMENRDVYVTIRFGEELCDLGRAAGQIHTEKVVPTWQVAMGDHKGYGRSMEEAICKLAIVTRIADDAT